MLAGCWCCVYVPAARSRGGPWPSGSGPPWVCLSHRHWTSCWTRWPVGQRRREVGRRQQSLWRVCKNKTRTTHSPQCSGLSSQHRNQEEPEQTKWLLDFSQIYQHNYWSQILINYSKEIKQIFNYFWHYFTDIWKWEMIIIIIVTINRLTLI